MYCVGRRVILGLCDVPDVWQANARVTFWVEQRDLGKVGEGRRRMEGFSVKTHRKDSWAHLESDFQAWSLNWSLSLSLIYFLSTWFFIVRAELEGNSGMLRPSHTVSAPEFTGFYNLFLLQENVFSRFNIFTGANVMCGCLSFGEIQYLPGFHPAGVTILPSCPKGLALLHLPASYIVSSFDFNFTSKHTVAFMHTVSFPSMRQFFFWIFTLFGSNFMVTLTTATSRDLQTRKQRWLLTHFNIQWMPPFWECKVSTSKGMIPCVYYGLPGLHFSGESLIQKRLCLMFWGHSDCFGTILGFCF